MKIFIYVLVEDSMTLQCDFYVFFKRPNHSDPERIFIGLHDGSSYFRIGYKPTPFKNSIKLVRHFYKIDEEIIIIQNPNIEFIDKNDLEYIKKYLKNI